MQIGCIVGTSRIIGREQGYLGLPLRFIKVDCPVNGPDTPAMESAWLPLPTEIGRINQGQSVILRVIGSGLGAERHPPVMLYVGDGDHVVPADMLPNGLHLPTLIAVYEQILQLEDRSQTEADRGFQLLGASCKVILKMLASMQADCAAGIAALLRRAAQRETGETET